MLTFLLLLTGVSGLWIAGKHWYGWILYSVNEVLWELSGLLTHNRALQIMAPVWLLVGLRNMVVQYRHQPVKDLIKTFIELSDTERNQVLDELVNLVPGPVADVDAAPGEDHTLTFGLRHNYDPLGRKRRYDR